MERGLVASVEKNENGFTLTGNEKESILTLAKESSIRGIMKMGNKKDFLSSSFKMGWKNVCLQKREEKLNAKWENGAGRWSDGTSHH